MLQACGTSDRVLAPTALFNEGWMLRSILDWFSRQPEASHPLGFASGASWFSEGLLPSFFRPQRRADATAETWTRADGVIGHIKVGNSGRTDVALRADASQFVVLEAKLFSKLSKGVKNAPYFDQAARYVACIAEVLRKAERPLTQVSNLAFYIIAPDEQVSRGVFSKEVSKESIRTNVSRRIEDYPTKDGTDWLEKWFLPTLPHIRIGCQTWENILSHITSAAPTSGTRLSAFYQRCLEFNRPENRGARA